jgi:hypothetical protein
MPDVAKLVRGRVKADEVKLVVGAVNEMSESYTDLAQALKGTADTARTAKQLWRSKNRPWLIKVGLALIAFPDPTISDVVGAAFVAAGTVQMGIKRQTLYAEDVFRTFQGTMRKLRSHKETV